MVFPQVEATNTSNEAAVETSHTVSLPAGIQAGETLLAFFAVDTAQSVSWPAGWNEIFEVEGDSAVTLAIAWRKATGGEGATITVTTGDSRRSAHASYRISGTIDPTVAAPEVSTGATGISANPDSDSLAAGGGTRKYLWIAIEGNDSDETVSAYPTNYDSNQLNSTGGISIGLGVASDEVETNTQDPGTFTISASEQWVACTVAVSPEPIVVVGSKSANMAAKMMAAGLI